MVRNGGEQMSFNFYPRSPRGERRKSVLYRNISLTYFYPRSPRGERPVFPALGLPPINFYPRSPRGERRSAHSQYCRGSCDFYPRSPRGERPATLLQGLAGDTISIHAPREGSDPGIPGRWTQADSISIHAPREGSDAAPCSGPARPGHFYPRSPRGERHA